jgi:NTE family protein
MKMPGYPAKHMILLLSLFMMMAGCSCPQHYHPTNNPPPLPDCPVVPQPVRLGLVLGGGGAKGLAHVGVLEELEYAGIPIDLIVGCSAGSIVGALYADCPSCDHLKEVLLSLKTNLLIDLDFWHARYGLCQGKSLRQFLYANLCATNFDQLKIPFFLVATDLYSSELVIIGGGPIVPAVEASCSIPLVFVPVPLHGRTFVDGGVIDPVPVRVAKNFNAEVIVAVDLRGLLPQTFPTNLFEVATRSAEITLLWQSEDCIRNADVVIRPELGNIGTFADEYNEQIYQAGKESARACIPKIKALLAEKEKQRFEMR